MKTRTIFSLLAASSLIVALPFGCGLTLSALARAAARVQHPLPPVRPGSNYDHEKGLTQGRAVADLVRKKSSEALFSRFTPEMAAQVPPATIRDLLQGTITPATPLGTAITETVVDGQGGAVYEGVYHWTAENDLTLTVVFAGKGADKIAGMLIKPTPTDANRDAALTAARGIADRIQQGDTEAVLARFTPSMAKAVSSETVHSITAQFFAKEPLSTPISEAIASDAGGWTYVTERRWKPGQSMGLVINLTSGDDHRIGGMRFVPALPKNLPPDPHADYQLKTTLHLPFAPGDDWFVFWGGDTRPQNYHVDAPDQRHAYDILVKRDGATHEGDGTHPEQYYAWGRKIVAPAAATVIEAVDGLPDNRPQVQTDAAHAAGNHVLLDLGNHEYALLAHLQHGSVRVKQGEKVTPGQLLGLCGNSGNTSEPHLHFHVQDKPYLFRDALGLPVTFVGYVSNGKKVERGSPVRGEQIHAAN